MSDIVMTQERLIQLAEPFGTLMNRMQTDGDNISDVVTGGLYALGVALASMRVVIQVDDPIAKTLSPLWAGYMDFIDEPVNILPRVTN